MENTNQDMTKTPSKKIDKAIEYVKSRLGDYQNPGSYQEAEWYIKCDAKADILEEVLSRLEGIKRGE